jgi:hypothetical protein
MLQNGAAALPRMNEHMGKDPKLSEPFIIHKMEIVALYKFTVRI